MKQISINITDKVFFRWLASVLLMLMLLLSGCQQDSSNNDIASNEDDGEVIIGLTDAKGDFTNYTVDVTSLTLTKANGAVVEVLPLTTTIDFSQYTEMTEFLTAAMVPNGAYVKGSMALDYSNAEIWVEDENGNSVKVTTIQDSEGNPVTTLDVSVYLEGRNKLIIAPGVPSHLTFDFDLNASNKVEFDSGTNEAGITVEPFLLADVEMQRPKIHRVRGPLDNVNVARSQFDVVIRPFYHRVSNDRRFGHLTVKTTEKTLFEIDDTSYRGSDGLTVLDSMPRFTAMIVIGDLKFRPRRFEAREVYAGSSVPGGDMDVAKGTVISRNGNVLMMKGATLIRADGSVIFNDVVEVTVADSTRVKKQLSMDEHVINDISVGQKVSVFGTLTNSSVDNLQIDASNGLVRLRLTTLRATSITTPAATDVDPTFIVDLQSINGRRVPLFDFAGTGIDAVNDADPGNYEIFIDTLDLSDIGASTPVKVRGFVTPFGSAPEDFDATTVVDLTSIPANMTMNWNPATNIPFITTTTESLTLNSIGVGLFHHIARGGIVHDMTALMGDTQILATADGEGVFIIRQKGSPQLHTQFATFIDDINTRLADGDVMHRIAAHGTFNDAANSMIAKIVWVTVSDASSIEPVPEPIAQ